MALDALLARLEGRSVTPVTSGAIADVTRKPAPMLACTPVTPVTAQNDDTATEARRQRVLTMLAENPSTRYAVIVDDPDADPVLLTVGIRGLATFEMVAPKERFDAFKLMELIDQHGKTVH